MRGQLDLTINHWGLTGFDHQNTEVIFENWWLLWWYFDIFWWLNPNDNHENCWLIIIGGHWLTSFIWNFTKRTHELGIPNFTKQCVYVYLGMTSWLLRTAPKAPRAEKNVVYPENMLGTFMTSWVKIVQCDIHWVECWLNFARHESTVSWACLEKSMFHTYSFFLFLGNV